MRQLKNTKNLAKCLEYYNKGIELFPYHFGFYANRAIAYQNADQHENAIKDFKKAILLNPNSPGNHFHLGMYAANEGYYAEAIISLSIYILLENDTERSVTALSTLEQLCDLTFEAKSKQINWNEETDYFEKLNEEILNNLRFCVNILVKIFIFFYFCNSRQPRASL